MWDKLVRLGETWLAWKIIEEVTYLVAIILGLVFVAWSFWQVTLAAGRVFMLW